MPEWPRYVDLPTLDGVGEHHAWDVFGPGDEFGCLNFITPAVVLAAAQEVRLGVTVNLNLPLGEPQPQFWSTRGVPQHHETKSRNIRDDYVDGYYMQGSTQWDGFRHMRYRQFGYFGGRQDDALDERGEIGVGVWAERGIISRGVLVDAAGYLARQGRPLAPDERFPIGPALTEEILEAQGVTVRRGDILLFRTGWLDWYRGLSDAERTELATRLNHDRSQARLPGLAPSLEMVGWLWNQGIAAVAVDNPTAETIPYVPAEGWGHHRLLVLLGMPLGELWDMRCLAEICSEDEQYSFLLTTAPLNIPGGVASPANAYAIL